MGYERAEGADFGVTVNGTCPIRGEVLGDQIEFWFGDVGSGLYVYFDRPGFARFARVQAEMVQRWNAVPEGAPVDVVAGDNHFDIHGSRADKWGWKTASTHTRIDMDARLPIEDFRPMKYYIVATEAQIELSHGTGSLYMTVSEAGLIGLMEFMGAVLREMRARAESAQTQAASLTS